MERRGHKEAIRIKPLREALFDVDSVVAGGANGSARGADANMVDGGVFFNGRDDLDLLFKPE